MASFNPTHRQLHLQTLGALVGYLGAQAQQLSRIPPPRKWNPPLEGDNQGVRKGPPGPTFGGGAAGSVTGRLTHALHDDLPDMTPLVLNEFL